MRSDIIRIYKSVHTWTGIITGMALFIAFYAGALTVFKEPLALWASPPTAELSAGVPLDRIQPLIASTVAANTDAASEFWLHLQPTDHHPSPLSWHVMDEGAGDHDQLSGRHYVATLGSDGTGEIAQAHPSRLGEFIDVLHRVVGLPVDSDANRWIMGVVAALYTVALISGVIILLPTLVKDFFALRLGKNLKRMWLDAHNVVGIVSLPFHLVMAVTAVGFAFHDGIYLLQDKLIHDGELASAFAVGSSAPPPMAPRDPALMLPPAELVAKAQALSPSFEPTMLQYLQVTGPRAVVRVWGDDTTAMAPRFFGSFAALDPYSGRVLNTDYLPGQQAGAFTAVSALFALHFATFGGLSVQWIYFLLGLAGAWLFYSGNLLWVESRRKAQRRGAAMPVQRRDTSLMAAATVGICLGCISGISLTIVAGRWLHGEVADLTAWHRYVYYAVFFGGVGWAFLRGAARASVDLLLLAAACTAAIPLTTLLALGFPSLQLWAHTHLTALSVDLTALAGALCLLWMARAAARRIEHGRADSVWSVRQRGAMSENGAGEEGAVGEILN